MGTLYIYYYFYVGSAPRLDRTVPVGWKQSHLRVGPVDSVPEQEGKLGRLKLTVC